MKYSEPEWDILSEDKQKLRFFTSEDWENFYNVWMKRERFRLIDVNIVHFLDLHPQVYYNIMLLVNGKDHIYESALDIGCANGETLFSMYFDNLIKKGLGVDVSSDMIEYANQYLDYIQKREINNNQKNSLSFKQGLFEDIIFDSTYDIILCNDVLEHFVNVNKALDKIITILDVNGLFCGHTPKLNHCDATPHLHYYTKESLKDLLSIYFKKYDVEEYEVPTGTMLQFYGVKI